MKPFHYIIIWGISFILLLWWYFFFFWGNEYITEVEEKISTKNISFNDETILASSDEELNYYQVQIYPADFDFTCTNNEEVCNKVLQRQEKIGVFSLWSVGREITQKSEALDMNFDLILWKKTDSPFILKDIFSQLYLDDGSIMMSESAEENIENEVIERGDSQSKGFCVESIKNSLPEGISELDTTFQDRVELECTWLENINDIRLAFWWITDTQNKNNQIDLELRISSLRVEYTFFSKIDGKFTEVSSEEKVIKKQIRLSSVIDLADFN